MNLKPIKIDKETKIKVGTPVPESLIQQRQGGGNKMLSYISGSTVTDMLNDVFGYAWNWEVKKEWITESRPYFNRYSKSANKTVLNGVEGAWEDQGPVAHVLCTITVYMQAENGQIVEIKKDGYGSKSILGKQNDQESIFKAAGTDALKKAASLLGIGLSLYRNEEESDYFNEINSDLYTVWTDELMKKYPEQWAYIQHVCESNGYSYNDLSYWVDEVTDRKYTNLLQMPEECIDKFVDALKQEGF